MTRFRLALAPTLALATIAPAAAQEPKPLDRGGLLERARLVAGPAHPFRYNQGTDPYGPSTMTLLERGRRAFFPGEGVELSFRLPDDARVETPLAVRVALSLHDLDGTRRQEVGTVTLEASDKGVEGTLTWTVPDVAEGRYLLAGRFLDDEGAPLRTRSDVVFVAPDYPRLLSDAEAALEKLRAKADALDAEGREISLPSTEMLVEDARMRWSDFGHAPRDWTFVRRQLETARDFADRLAGGHDPWRGRTGAFVKAYRSEIDDTLQPYAVFVPPSYDPSREWPMMLSLHGAWSNHLLNRRRVFGLGNRLGESDFEAIRNEVDFPDLGFIVVSPYGRGEVAGYEGIAEQDVLRVLEHVEKAYRVDPDRVHLTGLSMGGGGTWQLGLRYPDRFASIAPVCAVGDLTLFPFTAQASAEDRELMELTGPSGLAANALNQHVFIFHGDEDPAVVVEHSRRMVETYRALRWLDHSVFYFELPGVHHFAWDFAYRDASLFRRVEGIRRDRFPERVVYTTFSPRYRQAYWLRIDRIDRGFRLARIEGRRREGLFEVKAENLSAFSLQLSPEVAPPGERIEVRVDGRRAFRGVPPTDVLSFARRGGRWAATKPWSGPAQGPPDHAAASFRPGGLAQYGRHLYVYGTAGDAATTAALRAGAERLADWGPNVRARWRVVADAEVTTELLATHDLVLVGDAGTNTLVARLHDRLPIRKDETGTHAGGRRVAGPEAAFRLLHPNPLAPGRYVLIYGGRPEALARFLPGGARRPPSTAADYVVIDESGDIALEGYFRDDYRIGAR